MIICMLLWRPWKKGVLILRNRSGSQDVFWCGGGSQWTTLRRGIGVVLAKDEKYWLKALIYSIRCSLTKTSNEEGWGGVQLKTSNNWGGNESFLVDDKIFERPLTDASCNFGNIKTDKQLALPAAWQFSHWNISANNRHMKTAKRQKSFWSWEFSHENSFSTNAKAKGKW